MTTREVLLSTCDRCTTEVTTEAVPKRRRGRGELVLPPGWLHVSGATNTSVVFEMDLCDECKKVVLEAAGKANRSSATRHTTSSTEKEQPETVEADAATLKKKGKEKQPHLPSPVIDHEDTAPGPMDPPQFSEAEKN